MHALKGTPRSRQPRGRTSPWHLMSILPLLALCACVNRVQVIRPASGCSQLVGPTLRQPNPPAAIPPNSQGAVAQFGNSADAGQEAEGKRAGAILEVVERCEARDAEWIRQIEKGKRGLFR